MMNEIGGKLSGSIAIVLGVASPEHAFPIGIAVAKCFPLFS